jgi:drug/metabolite transporter (DMT)-like permease
VARRGARARLRRRARARLGARVALAGDGTAIAAGLAATLSYGLAASWTKRRLAGVDPLANAAGSQLAATIVLAPLVPFAWPQAAPSAAAWANVVALGVASTGIAYLLFFRLIARVGPAKAIAVTFLVPVFAIVWGALFLGEAPTAPMLAAGLVVLAGTALSTGAIEPRRIAHARRR